MQLFQTPIVLYARRVLAKLVYLFGINQLCDISLLSYAPNAHNLRK